VDDVLKSLPLRRKLFGGYKVADVQLLIAHWRNAVDRMEREMVRAGERAAELEVELHAMRTRLESYIAREAEVNRALMNIHAQAEEIEEQARRQARKTLQEAEERAAEMRSEAVARVATTGQQIDELLQVRESLLGAMRSAISEFERFVARIERGEPAPAPSQPQAATGSPASKVTPAPETPPPPPPVQPSLQPQSRIDDRLFEGRVELDAGPFVDFASLSAFERSLGRIGNVADVYVRRFSDDRALIEVTLAQPTPLLRAIVNSLPYTIEVHETYEGRLVLAVHVPTSVA